MIYFAWDEGEDFLVFVLANDLMMTLFAFTFFGTRFSLLNLIVRYGLAGELARVFVTVVYSTVIAYGYTLVCPTIWLLYYGFLWSMLSRSAVRAASSETGTNTRFHSRIHTIV